MVAARLDTTVLYKMERHRGGRDFYIALQCRDRHYCALQWRDTGISTMQRQRQRPDYSLGILFKHRMVNV